MISAADAARLGRFYADPHGYRWPTQAAAPTGWVDSG
jgi:hypothetical protein